MSEESSNIPDNLRLKFPDLRAIKRTPVLARVNGIGFGLCGRRDFDEETRTYVKTYCFCLVFIPIVALAAYRVADAQRGWYFIGKERLSSFAKSCNWGLLCLTLMFAGIMAEHAVTSSPDYRAGQELKRAGQVLRAGNALRAAGIYRDVADGPAQAEEGKRGLRQAVEECLTNEAPDKVEGAFRLLAALPPRVNSPGPIFPDAYQRGLALVEKFRARNPDGALGILHQLGPLAGATNASLKPLEIELLKAAIAANPDNTNQVVELALIYEDQKQLDEGFKLLAPYRQRLGATEGARILGQHLLQESKYEDAYPLLYPYVQTRLEKLHAVEKSFSSASQAAYRRAFDYLNQGRAERSFYDEYKKASKAGQQTMVDAFVEKRLRTDGAYQRAQGELAAANRIVYVTLDLGIVQLNRAQALSDPAARKTELEAAEKTFLAIRGLAGDTDAFRMFLGQVYYWLGKSKEGKELFDQMLASHKRDYETLLALGRTLREVGDDSQARELTEEAFRTATKDKDKFEAASLRSKIQKDNEDEIAWLEKSDPRDASIQVDLNSARGNKALHDGNRDVAAQSFRKAIAGYQNIPQTAAALNNCGLVYLSLYRVTGDLEDHNRGLALLERAITLSPGHSVLLMNIAPLLVTRAYMDVVGKALRFDAIKETPNSSMLRHLYKDEQERAEVYQRLRQSEHMQKALGYLDKAMLLAPKNAGVYNLAIDLQSSLRDLAELEKLRQRLRIAMPDLTELKREAQAAYDPAKDKQRLEHLELEIRRYEALLDLTTVKEDPLTLTFVEIELNALRQRAALCGATVDSQKLLDQAQAIHERQPTSASLGTLIASCFFHAHDELQQQSAEYAQLAAGARRTLEPRELLACLLEREGALAPLIRQNASLRQALELLKEEARLFPSFRTVDEWALFRTIDPNETPLLVRKLNENKAARLADELQFQVNPFSGSVVLEQYWTARMNGDEARALQIYQQALRDGVPLPAL